MLFRSVVPLLADIPEEDIIMSEIDAHIVVESDEFLSSDGSIHNSE
jgi:hypothetical protein